MSLRHLGKFPDRMSDLPASELVLYVCNEKGRQELSEKVKDLESRLREAERRIKMALEYAIRYGQTDGSHHKTWVIDQTVRMLTGCLEDSNEQSGESEEYRKLITNTKAGEVGPETYDWDIGTPP